MKISKIDNPNHIQGCKTFRTVVRYDKSKLAYNNLLVILQQYNKKKDLLTKAYRGNKQYFRQLLKEANKNLKYINFDETLSEDNKEKFLFISPEKFSISVKEIENKKGDNMLALFLLEHIRIYQQNNIKFLSEDIVKVGIRKTSYNTISLMIVYEELPVFLNN